MQPVFGSSAAVIGTLCPSLLLCSVVITSYACLSAFFIAASLAVILLSAQRQLHALTVAPSRAVAHQGSCSWASRLVAVVCHWCCPSTRLLCYKLQESVAGAGSGALQPQLGRAVGSCCTG
jgi:hypothetical protein